MVTLTTPLPDAPQRGDGRADFSDDADAFAAALSVFQTQLNQQALDVEDLAELAQTAAATAVNAPGTLATSSTSLTIGPGAQAPVVQAGKNFAVGMWVTLARSTDPTKWMIGPIGAYNSTNGDLAVDAKITNGAGTFSDWTIALSPPINFVAATALQVIAGATASAAVTPASLFAAAVPVALADAATITPDFNAGLNFTLAIAGNRTLANPSNLKVGQSGVIVVTQDGTGSRTLAYGSYWKFPGGAPALSTPAGSIDLISYYVLTPTVILCTLIRSFA